MEKQKKYAWQDTNMSLFGSDVEKKIKAAAADGEEQWSDAGQKVELRIWRIEQFKVVEWPRSKHGSFHEGDTYIVLNTYRPEGVLDGTASNPDALAWDVHFWIGEYSTQDEYGTAAYKTVELDCKLEDAAIQHRETMGHESELFRSYFAGGIRLLEGGTETGFTHVEEEVVPVRLFQVKGTAGNLVLREVKKKRDQMNSGDVFVLDTGGMIFVWSGAQANVHEKRQGGEFARGIKSSRSGRAEVTFMEEGQSDGDPSSESDEFWKHLPGTRKIRRGRRRSVADLHRGRRSRPCRNRREYRSWHPCTRCAASRCRRCAPEKSDRTGYRRPANPPARERRSRSGLRCASATPQRGGGPPSR